MYIFDSKKEKKEKGNDILGQPCYSEAKAFHHALIKGKARSSSRSIDPTADKTQFGK